MAKTQINPEETVEFWMELVSGPFMRNSDGTVDCTFAHPRHGPVPFTASKDDPSLHGRLIYEGINQGGVKIEARQ